MNESTVITWDNRKNESNFKKHGVWFHEAQVVILSPLTLLSTNAHPSGLRVEYLGYSRKRLLYVVTEEKSDEEIRIVSARPATADERRRYEEGI